MFEFTKENTEAIVATAALMLSVFTFFSSRNATIRAQELAEQEHMQSKLEYTQLKIQADEALKQSKIQSDKELEQFKIQSEKELKDARLHALFSGFDQANGELMRNPNLLTYVHGLGQDKDVEELENIAYLGILIDAFHHYWGKQYSSYEEAIKEEPSNFLHRIVEVDANYERWKELRSINYGEDDEDFLAVMDKLFEDAKEINKKKKA